MKRGSKSKFRYMVNTIISAMAAYEDGLVGNTADRIAAELGLSYSQMERFRTHGTYEDMNIREVENLAQIAWERVRFNRLWIKDFLKEAHYPDPDRFIKSLIDQDSQLNRILNNLPKWVFDHHDYVDRPEPFQQIIDALIETEHPSEKILLVGKAGVGKTRLSEKVARECVIQEGTVRKFDVLVWVSGDPDKKLTLNSLFDVIAQTLNRRNIIQYQAHSKRQEVERLLRTQTVLLIFDNLGRYTNQELLLWLANQMPSPTRALITSQEDLETLRNRCLVIPLLGMNETEAMQLIRNRLRALNWTKPLAEPLRLQKLISGVQGNPLFIIMALGLVKEYGFPLDSFVEDLILFASNDRHLDPQAMRHWSLLTPVEQRILLAMHLFSDSANRDALATVAGVSELDFAQGAERLTDLALLDLKLSPTSAHLRYSAHSVIRSVIKLQFNEWQSFQMEAYARRTKWYINLTQPVGSCWSNIERLEALDLEREAILEVMRWTLANGEYLATCQLAKGTRYFYYVRGYFDKRLAVDRMNLEAAEHMADRMEEAKALGYYLQIVLRRNDLEEAQTYLPRLKQLAETIELHPKIQAIYYQTMAMYEMAIFEFAKARKEWEASIQASDDMRNVVAAHRWIAKCLYRDGQLIAARAILAEWLLKAKAWNFTRATALYYIELARIDLALNSFTCAEEEIAQSHLYLAELRCPTVTAELKLLQGCLYRQQSKIYEAKVAFQEAIEFATRTGLQLELSEAQDALDRL